MSAASDSRGVHVPEGAGRSAAPGEGLPRASSAARHRRKPTKADLAVALRRAEQALFAEPGAYTYTEPVRIEVRLYAARSRPCES